VALAPTGKRRLVTAHTHSGRSTLRKSEFCTVSWQKGFARHRRQQRRAVLDRLRIGKGQSGRIDKRRLNAHTQKI
jgi:hypothetical protein